MFAFSTCWNASRHADGEELVNEILLLGFENIEVSSDARPSLLSGLEQAAALGRVSISGLHSGAFNEGPRERSSLIDSDPAKFDRAVRATLRSITRAAQLDADYLILDLGDVEIAAVSPTLMGMAANGRLNDRDFVRKKIELIRERESFSAGVVDRLGEALKILLPYGEEKKVALALKISASYEGVPTWREVDSLLQAHDSPALGYWHDFSAAQEQADLDFLDHPELLEKMASRTVGAHLSDCSWPGRGGLVPGLGDVRFQSLMPSLPSDIPIAWALNPRCKTDDIKSSLQTFQVNGSKSLSQ